MKKLHPALVVSLLADVVLVVLFVAIGRNSHDETEALTGLLRTLWPFAAGLGVGWLATQAWRRPTALIPSGVGIWVATVAVGMILRVVSGQGIAFSFVIVALVVLGFFLLGWRAVYSFVGARIREHRAKAPHTERTPSRLP